jgi:hypothetical protein
MKTSNAILLGPCVGEFYWECGRFAPLLSHMVHKKYRNRNDITYIVLTREERFDLYGMNANILIPLRIPGDYEDKFPDCYRLNGLGFEQYKSIADKFYKHYKENYNIIQHIYPDIRKPAFTNKNQFNIKEMYYKYFPRKENYDLVNEYLPKEGPPIVILASRLRKGFKRNWKGWPEFYDVLSEDKELVKRFRFVICGKPGEYVPDEKDRFYDMSKIKLGSSSSYAGLLLVIMERAFFTFGSQSAIPNISLLYGVDVLEFGHQKQLHTVVYNHFKTPITFFEDRKYDSSVRVMCNRLKKLLIRKENGDGSKSMVIN